MVERGSGGVIVTASTAGMQPLPYQATYSASKAFALNFTDALATELRGTGVRAMSVNPGPVPTEWQAVAGFHGGEDKVPGKIEASQVVSEALEAWDKGKRSVVPGAVIRWVMRASALSPRAIQLPFMERQYRP
jgi:short-subunit dehydrogenase